MGIEMSEKETVPYEANHQTAAGGPFPTDEKIKQMADLFKTFGDPTRIRILIVLGGDELCVRDIARALSMTASAISHQLRILKQMQLVKFRKEGKTVFYSLLDSHVETILHQGMDHVNE